MAGRMNGVLNNIAGNTVHLDFRKAKQVGNVLRGLGQDGSLVDQIPTDTSNPNLDTTGAGMASTADQSAIDAAAASQAASDIAAGIAPTGYTYDAFGNIVPADTAAAVDTQQTAQEIIAQNAAGIPVTLSQNDIAALQAAGQPVSTSDMSWLGKLVQIGGQAYKYVAATSATGQPVVVPQRQTNTGLLLAAGAVMLFFVLGD